jgi:hypothetical protein
MRFLRCLFARPRPRPPLDVELHRIYLRMSAEMDELRRAA